MGYRRGGTARGSRVMSGVLLRVIAEADPGAIARVLQPLQSLNIVPERLRVDRIGDAYLEIAVTLAANDLSLDAASQITAKLSQIASVMVAVACDAYVTTLARASI